MTIQVGTKLKQVAAIEEYGFNYVGHEFVVTKENDLAFIAKGTTIGVGFGIEKDKVAQYFEVIRPVEVLENKIETIDGAKVIRNGKVTVVILEDGSKGISKCIPDDTYDEEKGFDIALAKAQIKSLTKKLKVLTK